MNDSTNISTCICETNAPKKKNGLNYMCLSAFSYEIPRIYFGVTKEEGQFLFAAYGNGPDDISSTHYILNYCPECGRKLR